MKELLKQRARELRSAGLTYMQIGKELGIGLSTAHRYVDPIYESHHKKRDQDAENTRDRKRRLTDQRYRCAEALKVGRYQARRFGHEGCAATVDEVLAALIGQQGCCAMCSRHESEVGKRMLLDHCHETGRFRGWLCRPCNSWLGAVGDDPQRAAEMVQRYAGSLSELSIAKCS